MRFKESILLIGGFGFLGRNIIKYLSQKSEISLVVFDHIVTPDFQEYETVKSFQGELIDTNKIIALIENENVKTIIHCVSTLYPDSNFSEYDIDIIQVILPSIKILDYCANNKIKFVYFSSGGTIYGNKSTDILNEDMSPSPISFYGLSKLCMEEVILFYHNRFEMDYLILRPSNPYGFGQNIYGKQGLVAVLIGKIINHETALIYGDGSSLRDYIDIDDFVYYVIELLAKDIRNIIINIGSGRGYSINQIISLVEDISETRINIQYVSPRKNDVKRIILDITKLNEIVPHKQIDINEGIEKFYAKILRNGYRV
jgi:UDP-glucose 4-epimerase